MPAERRRDFRIVKQTLIVRQFRSGHGKLALRRFQSRLPGIHLRRRRQVLPLRIIHFLLRHNSGLALEHAIQPRVLQMQRVVLRLITLQFVLCPR